MYESPTWQQKSQRPTEGGSSLYRCAKQGRRLQSSIHSVSGGGGGGGGGVKIYHRYHVSSKLKTKNKEAETVPWSHSARPAISFPKGPSHFGVLCPSNWSLYHLCGGSRWQDRMIRRIWILACHCPAQVLMIAASAPQAKRRQGMWAIVGTF